MLHLRGGNRFELFPQNFHCSTFIFSELSIRLHVSSSKQKRAERDVSEDAPFRLQQVHEVDFALSDARLQEIPASFQNQNQSHWKSKLFYIYHCITFTNYRLEIANGVKRDVIELRVVTVEGNITSWGRRRCKNWFDRQLTSQPVEVATQQVVEVIQSR